MLTAPGRQRQSACGTRLGTVAMAALRAFRAFGAFVQMTIVLAVMDINGGECVLYSRGILFECTIYKV